MMQKDSPNSIKSVVFFLKKQMLFRETLVCLLLLCLMEYLLEIGIWLHII